MPMTDDDYLADYDAHVISEARKIRKDTRRMDAAMTYVEDRMSALEADLESMGDGMMTGDSELLSKGYTVIK